MNPAAAPTPGIALFGGVFDPIHSGHLAVARAACRRFRLDRIYFIPTSRPPHKTASALTPFAHRYAMVALACAGKKRFIPSLAEDEASAPGHIFYTIDTVRGFLRQLADRPSRFYYIIGADAFQQIGTWKEHRQLLQACEFIVAHRPGFPLGGRAVEATTGLDRNRTHLLRTVSSEVSSTAIRQRRKQGRSIHGLVPAAVEEYIEKLALYRE